ncbi:MAG: aminotransferase class I/II-fold pyridoxal phosphate-dependent enzyme [Muribaculaceae bacterium]|nr:aminotransferase class I/II-fold pyridoxal phosphate-dependent enzyme [Muribaculaceae bacterium]MDE6754413.1 aminotransferase class I/II-fold pyridoxal phosphate-dependent enzyme [Muribaculaceae bacterium]
MDRILLCLCHMSGKEMDFINEAFKDNWVVPLGPNVIGFEKDLEHFFIPSSHTHPSLQASDLKISHSPELLAQKKIVALSAGTAAIHLALVALGVGHSDEVIVQSFTFSASANPVTYVGATPVFVDSEPDTWNMDPVLLDRAIADRIEKTGKKPKAIIPVYLYGMPAKISEILEVAARWEIPVIEDSAEAFGSKYKGQFCGTFGIFGIMSFNGNKMITTSGGGALVCPDEEIARLVTCYATQSREPVPWYEHERVGFNYRLSNISAGIGRGQMTIAEEHLAHHRNVQQQYRELFAAIPGIELHDNPSPDFDSNFWLCAITFTPDLKIKGDDGCGRPEALRRALDKENIETRHLWKPMHLQPFFRNCPAYVNGVSEDLFSRGLCLPAGPYVGPDEVKRIVNAISSARL